MEFWLEERDSCVQQGRGTGVDSPGPGVPVNISGFYSIWAWSQQFDGWFKV